jgi:hypothetical protein
MIQVTRRLLSARSWKLSLVSSLAAASLGVAAFAQVLPPDAQPTCTVASAEFAGWFTSGTPALNGVVNPANSITFVNSANNCIFYKWSEQMFMWLASPAPSIYGGGDRIFNSPVFYDVSPPAADGSRTLIPHVVGLPRFFPVRFAQVGPHKLPVVMDVKGNMLEVVTAPAAPNGNSLIRNTDGQSVAIERVTIGKDNNPSFLDRAGKPIATRLALTPELLPRSLVAPREIREFRAVPGQKAALNVRLENAEELAVRTRSLVTTLNKFPVAEKFIVNRSPIFVNFNTGTVVPVEQGQADGSVLIAHNGSLVYFATIVNDVYAYYLTGRKGGAIGPTWPTPGQFPVSQAALNQITGFAGKTFVDDIALAIEVKTAWVESSTLPDPQDYIQTMAQVPVYNTSNPNLWVPTGAMKTVKVSLLGIHVVGSANGHPEMIWATFEHKDNAPRAQFQYNATSGANPHTVSPSTVGAWALTANGSAGPFNHAHADYLVAPNIESAGGFTISPSDTLQEKAFGGGFNQSPNPLDPTTAASNTEVIAINNSIRSMMAAAGGSADLRDNYIMTGATWTIGGASPTGRFPGGNEVGTSRLANTTMETYQQGPDHNANGSNCFMCHTSNTTDVSHVFSDLKPLF